MRRDLRRAAWFLWITPFAAAMSRRLTATRTASSWPSLPTVAVAVLTRVFSSLFAALLRSARLALVMLRFFWLLMLATDVLYRSATRLNSGARLPLAPAGPNRHR